MLVSSTGDNTHSVVAPSAMTHGPRPAGIRHRSAQAGSASSPTAPLVALWCLRRPPNPPPAQKRNDRPQAGGISPPFSPELGRCRHSAWWWRWQAAWQPEGRAALDEEAKPDLCVSRVSIPRCAAGAPGMALNLRGDLRLGCEK